MLKPRAGLLPGRKPIQGASKIAQFFTKRSISSGSVAVLRARPAIHTVENAYHSQCYYDEYNTWKKVKGWGGEKFVLSKTIEEGAGDEGGNGNDGLGGGFHDPVASSDLTSGDDKRLSLPEVKEAQLKPREVVDSLDKYIVGQKEAKRAVAIALRNRWRRLRLPQDFKSEIHPKNILMIGPTGCGKSEIARRIAKLVDAPFIKVEATKFTEVGFHGRDVDQIIRDLVDVSINLTKKRVKERMRPQVEEAVEEKLLKLLIGDKMGGEGKESFRQLLRDGKLESTSVNLDVPVEKNPTISFDANPQMGDILGKIGKQLVGRRTEKRSVTIAEARGIIEEAEMEKEVDHVDIQKEAVQQVEENGIVFIDEIDKIVTTGDYRGADASSEGVQRDLLPLIEGCSISTKYGNVNTDHILFIASGAFHSCKPSDLMAELQGRLPIRVELSALTEEDLYRILTEPVTNLLRQQIELLKTENVELEFTDNAVREIASVSSELNRTVENIGARRLHTVVERIMEEISFDAPDRSNEKVVIDVANVSDRVEDLLHKSDLSKYIL